MHISHEPVISHVLKPLLPENRVDWLMRNVEIDSRIGHESGASVTRATLAMALNLLLCADLIDRVPAAADYVADCERAGRKIQFDHGALRTILMPEGPTGALPGGHVAFARILEPLGYRLAGVYPLPKLNMAGYAFAHIDYPETIPQFFVSELIVANFPEEFQAVADRVFSTSRDPLGQCAKDALSWVGQAGRLPLQVAMLLLRALAEAFGRQHNRPMLADYAGLLKHSCEAAWIATEGNAFNHVTDRVADVEGLAAAQRMLGRPMKPEVEVSANGRVRQTAFRAASVRRGFGVEGGRDVVRQVPGSFYEFITRDRIAPGGKLDLTFDSGNAQGIFGMTATAC